MSQDPKSQAVPDTTAPDARTIRPLGFRARAFKALALTPEAPVADWLAGLDAALKRSPTLFDGRAVILDLAALRPEREALAALIADLTARRIRVLGLEGAEGADAAFPPRLTNGRPTDALDLPVVPSEPETTSLTIEGSVRSGQCIVHPTGDVTVMGSVSSGAEILAGGNIHVYGTLRGRAIAGAARNPRARIYCRKFEPELLGIDRLVRTAEDMGPALWGKPAQVWREGSTIRLASLD
jgi:septum site-determining protein MinC